MNPTIPTGWRETTLGEIATFHYGKGLTADIRRGGNVPVYGSSGITGYHDNPLVEESGFIIGRKGTVGSIHYSNKPFYPIDTVYYLTKNDIRCDTTFFYYLLKTLGLEKRDSDSVIPGLNRVNAYSIKIKMPETEIEQRAIAEVLGSLDDKIELLRKQNETLEQIARTLFDEWFVKPTAGGVLPEGWKMKAFPEIAEFLNGLALQKYPAISETDYIPVIKIRELKSGITDGTDKASRDVPDRYIVHDGDVLFSWSGSLEVVIWKYGEGALNQHLFKVSSQEHPKWFIYLWLLKHLETFRSIAANKATTMGHIQRAHLQQAEVYIPSEKELASMDALLAPVFSKIVENNSIEQTLIYTRDLLLPRMMSGELRAKYE